VDTHSFAGTLRASTGESPNRVTRPARRAPHACLLSVSRRHYI